jgi:hypothetical protein
VDRFSFDLDHLALFGGGGGFLNFYFFGVKKIVIIFFGFNVLAVGGPGTVKI